MNSEEAKIRKAFGDKDWQEVKTNDTWQLFKIMAEFVEGFEKLSRIGPCVSIFGSARTAVTVTSVRPTPGPAGGANQPAGLGHHR